MDEFLAASLSFPTVVFTVLLGIAAVYWVLVIIGALGLDVLDADGGGGHAGHADVGHGDVGHVHGDAAHPGYHDVDSSPLVSLFVTLKLDSLPLTVSLSLVFFWGWLISHLSSHYLLAADRHWGLELALLLVALLLALLLASLVARPISPLFRSESGARRSALVGKIVTIDTSRVDASFGNATAEDGGAGLIVQVRCESTNRLTRGDRALVVSYDEARETFEVTPIDDLLPSDTSGGNA
ncbi:MAG: glycine zipper family protein [Deltaproteobacteria bacterium]|nr:glycine zipper family protein [Nannocystaceae bacterium]